LNIRLAKLKDFKELLFIEEQAHIYPWPETTLQWCLEQPHLRCFVLQKEQDIVGFAIYECVLDEATLLNLAINPDFQGHGNGRYLLQKSLCELDATIAKIFLEVRISNEPALQLYQSENFIEIGQRRNYYPAVAGREDARVFELDLDAYRLNLNTGHPT
jgi:[ribosomal protein S18]-alanine N-acetyltransferase